MPLNRNSILTGLLLLVLGGLLACLIYPPVQTNALYRVSKIGFVDLERSLLETTAGKQANSQFEKYRKSKQDELDRKQEAIQQEFAQLQKQVSVLQPEVRKQKEQELQKSYVEIQELYVKLERELVGEQTKLIEGILKQAEPTIKAIAQEEGYSMILDRSAVIWSNRADDLTDKVNARLK